MRLLLGGGAPEGPGQVGAVNNDRPHRGYRNQGRKPYETFTLGKKAVAKIKAKSKDRK